MDECVVQPSLAAEPSTMRELLAGSVVANGFIEDVEVSSERALFTTSP